MARGGARRARTVASAAHVRDEWLGDRARLLCSGSWHPQRQSRRSIASSGRANVPSAWRSGAVVAAQRAAQKRGDAEPLLERLAGCIDKGRSLVLETQKQVEAYIETIRQVDTTLDPASDGWMQRKRLYDALGRNLLKDEDSICQQMGRVMASFQKGLFVGGGRNDLPRDNLDLERWFRLPKGHERRIHGRCHAGVRIVQEGATMLLALDAHRHHPQPFTEEELGRNRLPAPAR